MRTPTAVSDASMAVLPARDADGLVLPAAALPLGSARGIALCTDLTQEPVRPVFIDEA